MNKSRLLIQTVFVTLAIATWSTTVSAQNNDTGNDTGGTEAGGAGLDADLDTSAFDGIQRGGSVTSAAASGFGPASQNGGGAGAGGGGGAFGGGGGFGGFGGLGGLFGGALGGGQQSAKPLIRTRLRSAIQVNPIPVQQVQMNANNRIVGLPNQPGMQNVQINMAGRTAVINGTATSDRDRRMAELLMRLEPGVSQVQNNVIVTQ